MHWCRGQLRQATASVPVEEPPRADSGEFAVVGKAGVGNWTSAGRGW